MITVILFRQKKENHSLPLNAAAYSATQADLVSKLFGEEVLTPPLEISISPLDNSISQI